MRTFEEIQRDYLATRENDKLIEVSHNCYEYANEQKRRDLRQEYIETLSEGKKLALKLHDKTCKCNHTDGCFFYYEINGLEDKWDSYNHKNYLEKAQKLLAEFSDEDIEKMWKMLDIIRY